MLTSPLLPLSPLFHPKSRAKAQLLLLGAILSPGKRTVTSAPRILGLAQAPGFAKYHTCSPGPAGLPWR